LVAVAVLVGVTASCTPAAKTRGQQDAAVGAIVSGTVGVLVITAGCSVNPWFSYFCHPNWYPPFKFGGV
jgi:hypothetical protein